MKVLALLVCAAGCAQQAFASFEMAMILQQYTPSGGPQTLHITRWDPVNKINLGQFSVFDSALNSKLAMASSAPGTVDLVQTYNSTLWARRYNYSTGIFDSEYDTGVGMNSLANARYVGNNLLVAGNFSGTNQARIYTQGGGLVRSYTMPSGTLQAADAIMTSSGITFVLSRQAGTSSGNKYTLTSHASGTGAITQSLVVADNLATTLHSLVISGTHIAIGEDEFSDRRIIPYTGTALSAAYTPGGYVTETSTLVNGHGDYIWGFGLDTVNTKMYFTTARLAGFTGNYWSINSTGYGTIYDSAMVLAPEPGTFVAVGVGVAALLRRRKKSR